MLDVFAAELAANRRLIYIFNDRDKNVNETGISVVATSYRASDSDVCVHKKFG